MNEYNYIPCNLFSIFGLKENLITLEKPNNTTGKNLTTLDRMCTCVALY